LVPFGKCGEFQSKLADERFSRESSFRVTYFPADATESIHFHTFEALTRQDPGADISLAFQHINTHVV
jgi:hypothetical protein